MSRFVRYGLPQPLPRSTFTVGQFAPTLGYVAAPGIPTPLGSLVSAQNVVVYDNRLEPRPRLARFGTGNVWADTPNGAFHYDDIGGSRYPVITSRSTVAFLADSGAWTALTYASGASGGVNDPPSGGLNDLFFGTSVYLPRTDVNIAVYVNNVDQMFAWGGPTATTFSTLTQAPVARDVTLFDNRPVAWNISESANTHFVTRVAWSVRGDPEDWTGIGAGTDDLVDMRGVGTRIFSTEDELLLFSTEETWRGRKIGLPFVLQFQPLEREIGLAHPRAVVQTPDGIIWLHRDNMVYRLAGGTISEIGGAIQRELHDTIINRDRAFFTTHPDTRMTTLWYSADANEPNRGFTFNTLNGTWAPQRFASHRVSVGITGFPASSSATTWGGLVGTIDEQFLTYDQLLGHSSSGNQADVLASSTGTIYSMSHSATSDDGVAMLAEAQLGAFGVDSPHRRKFLYEARLELTAASASSLSVAVSPDLGATFPTETRLAISAASQTTQAKVNLPVTGNTLTLRVRDDSGGNWRLASVAMTARVDGEAI